ncbi:acyltransferase family protein [Methylocystis parvus]|uniref:Acyltransferase n=1 Tax=Methylocystis parvus TaxID=134 RepID=A0A6B8M991_9HYPH|nr:acyltransferase [Methylocystis parvus]QGM99226.1 acyltransferase [Methylocystis parvus]WBK00392.1 acyltransferase [Methylocystis parvus OBBP]
MVTEIRQSGRELAERKPAGDVSDFLSRGTIPNLDGLRALAVLLVMLSHYGLGDWIPGAFGVTIFFFISGFLITTLLLRELAARRRVSLRNFFLRRFLRLQPELLAYLTLSAAIGSLYIGVPRRLDFLTAILYVANYTEAFSSIGLFPLELRWPQLWSLAVEEHFYLLFPICFFRFGPDGVQRLCIPFLLLILSWRIVLAAAGAPAEYLYVATDTRIDSIAYGCLVALTLWREPEILRIMNRWTSIGLVAAGLIVAATFAVRAPWFRETFRYSLQGVALSVGAVAMLTARGLRASAFLRRPTMRWMGRMSYGAYLWHLEPRHIFDCVTGEAAANLPLGEAVILSSIGVPITFLIAALSYHCFQQPFFPLRRRYGSHGL